MKKIIFAFILFWALIAFIIPSPASAQVTSTAKTAYPLNTNPDVPQNFHTYTQNVFIEVLSTATCFIGGVDIIYPDQKCLGIDPTTKKIGYVESNGGLVQVVGGMIGSTYNIPVSTSQYGHHLASNFGITRTAVAQNNTSCDGIDPASPAYRECVSGLPQATGTGSTNGFGKGIGFVGLTPVMNIWITFRNLTYLLFVFIFVLLGLGIMFRVNIDARTVMTIQNQIPKIIIGLILITLSYAIAGFLIDMMYVGIYLVIHLFNSQGLATITNIDTNPVMAVGPLGGINSIAGPAAQGVGGMVQSLFSGSVGNWIGMLVVGIIGSFIGGSIAPGVGSIVGGAIGIIGGLLGGSKLLGLIAMAIAYLIIAVAILSALFRVWFMLIKAYIFIFLDVIFAPFWIIGGLLPGAPGGVGPWLRSLIANLAAFPTVIVLFMIGKTMQEQSSNLGGNFIPPLIGNPGANSGEAIGSLLGLGIILIMPEAVTITKSTLKAPELKYTAAIGKAISAGQGVISKPIGGVKNELFGKDAFGNPRIGTKMVGERFGAFWGGLSGGKFERESYGPKASLLRPKWRGETLKDPTTGKEFKERNIFGKQTSQAKNVLTVKANEKAQTEAHEKAVQEARIRAAAEEEVRRNPEGRDENDTPGAGGSNTGGGSQGGAAPTGGIGS